MRTSLALLLALAAAPALAAQSPAGGDAPLTLAEAERLALEHQPELRAARAQTRAARARVWSAASPLLPQVTATGGVVRAGGERRDPATTWSYGLQGSQTLLDLGGIFDRSSASASAEAQAQTERDTRDAVLLAVRSAWFTAAAARDLVAVAQETLENRDAHLRQVQGFVEVGTRPEVDLAQARADRASALVSLITARNDLATSLARLNQAMGVAGATDYALAPITPPPVPGEEGALEPLVAEALSRRADLAALERDRAAGRAALRSRWGDLAPTVAASGRITQSGPRPDPAHTREDWSAGLTLTWPLLEGGRTRAQVVEASAALEVLDAQADALTLAVRLDVEQAWLSVKAARATVDASADAVANAKERLRLADARYQNGLGSGVELSDAQVEETGAAAREVQARFDLATARAQLLRALGRG